MATRPKKIEINDAVLRSSIPARYAIAGEELARRRLLDHSALIREGYLMVLSQWNALPAPLDPQQQRG